MEESKPAGKLYLIPTLMGDVEPLEVLPLAIKKVIDMTDYFIVENEKSARAFIKRVHPGKSQEKLIISVLNKYTEAGDVPNFLDPCLEGQHIGVLSEAGAPGIADPGADVVSLAHQKNIRVVPLVGPSSILMAMMASGMNGQNFAFSGYLPIDKAERTQRIKKLEKQSRDNAQSQIFMETPYRNEKFLQHLISVCAPATQLCVACDISLPTEYIKTAPMSWWKNNIPPLEKRPTIFVLQA